MTKNENSYFDNEIKRLLKDIWSFLDNETENGHMSLESKLNARQLMERCSLYLEDVVNSIQLIEDPETYNTSYVDMQAKTRKIVDEYVETDIKFRENIQDQEIYHDPSINISKSDSISDSSTMEEDSNLCPYANLPAHQVNMSEKNGPLLRREKFLFIEQHKKVYAAVQECFFLIYSSEKDSKPSRALDLNQYDAKGYENHGKEHKKKHASFELYNVQGKTYQFIASSEEEAKEWLMAINRKKLRTSSPFKTATVVHKRNLPPLPKTIKDKFEGNTYEIVDVEVDYSEIESKESSSIKQEEKKIKDLPVPLPPRVPEGVSFKSPLNSPRKGVQKAHSEDSSSNKDILLINFECASDTYDLVNPAESDSGQYDDIESTSTVENAKQNQNRDSSTYDVIQQHNNVAVTFKDVMETLNEQLKKNITRITQVKENEEAKDEENKKTGEMSNEDQQKAKMAENKNYEENVNEVYRLDDESEDENERKIEEIKAIVERVIERENANRQRKNEDETKNCIRKIEDKIYEDIPSKEDEKIKEINGNRSSKEESSKRIKQKSLLNKHCKIEFENENKDKNNKVSENLESRENEVINKEIETTVVEENKIEKTCKEEKVKEKIKERTTHDQETKEAEYEDHREYGEEIGTEKKDDWDNNNEGSHKGSDREKQVESNQEQLTEEKREYDRKGSKKDRKKEENDTNRIKEENHVDPLKPYLHKKPKFLSRRYKKASRSLTSSELDQSGRVSNLIHQFTRRQKCLGIDVGSSNC